MRNLKDILVLDIETVSGVERFEELSEGMKHHWERKASFFKNTEEQPVEESYFEKSAIYAEFGKVVVIAVGIFTELDGERSLRIKSFYSENE